MFNIKMEYTNKTLYIELTGILNEDNFLAFKRKVFTIVDDYEIKNIVLKGHDLEIIDDSYLESFRNDYKNKYDGKLTFKI
ncbi:MAG: hypothetical protein ACOXZS_04655 [Bacilli bacterium]|jgi:anti-anti-sigma regulatory factor